VKRAEAKIIGAPFFKLDIRTDDINDINAALYLLYGVLTDQAANIVLLTIKNSFNLESVLSMFRQAQHDRRMSSWCHPELVEGFFNQMPGLSRQEVNTVLKININKALNKRGMVCEKTAIIVILISINQYL
jgi:hypothetical protein